jgi:threonine/homoserine/homoserine lactone efflux protein
MKLYRLFMLGLAISFAGTLPLGTLNVAAAQLSISEGTGPAILFSLGALSVEILYVRISLAGISWLRRQKKWLRVMEWISLGIIVALAVGSFLAANRPGGGRNVILSNAMPRFVLGLAMSAINPLQIPFWFGWSSLLFSRQWLENRHAHYNTYVAGIGTGTLAGQLVFIFGARFLVASLAASTNLLNGVIGCLFAATALVLLWRMIRKKDLIGRL